MTASVCSSDDPKFHYGYTYERSGYTPCGKRIEEVVTTWYRDRVTCEICRAELTTMVTDSLLPQPPQTREGSRHDH